MNRLQIFNFESSDVRLLQKESETWFVAKDVCEILELSNVSMALQRLDEDEVTKFNLGGLSGETNFVNEYGLYSLVLGSRKPEAKKFKRWVTHEVIPSIRKHGAYMTPETIEKALTDPDTIIQLATNLKEERAKRMAAEVVIQNQKPKVLFADAVESSQSSILIGELAKLLKQNDIDMGQNRLFEWLRSNGYLIKRQGESFNLPTQYSMNLGIMDIKKRVMHNPDGSSRVTKTTKVTGKGQIYFIEKFLHQKENHA